MSHARKMIESAIAVEVKSCHRFDETPLGFQEGKSTATAIVRHIAGARTMEIGAVQDLKSA